MFILASASPRRKMLLSEAGFEFEVCPSRAEEIKGEDLPPEKLATRNAEIKAEDVYARKKMPCLGADTIVVLDGKILGKPADRSENARFLKKLSNNTHQVVTGFCLIVDGKKYVGSVTSDVTFNDLTDELIISYVDGGYGLDKAGGYGVQDGFALVRRIDGSYSNVVGLPMEAVSKLLKEKL